jgi:guanylate kinase
VLSLSATTREKRPGEAQGNDYNFISRQKFEEMIAAGEFLEYTEFSGNYYGTPVRWVKDKLASGKNVIIEIELKGAAQVRINYPHAVFVFLMPPSLSVLESRLRKRGTEDEQSILSRLRIARSEIAQGEIYDFVIVNHTIEKSCEQLRAVIGAAPCHIKYKRDYLRRILNHD